MVGVVVDEARRLLRDRALAVTRCRSRDAGDSIPVAVRGEVDEAASIALMEAESVVLMDARVMSACPGRALAEQAAGSVTSV